MKILVVAEARNNRIRIASRCALTLARQVAAATQGEIEIAIVGHELQSVAAEASIFAPTFVLDDDSFENPTADRCAAAVVEIVHQRSADLVIAASTSHSKDYLPRAAARLGGMMVSDAIAWEQRDDQLVWKRTMHAGGIAAWLATRGAPVVVTALTSSFEAAPVTSSPVSNHPVVNVQVDLSSLPAAIQLESTSSRPTGRPDVTEAGIVVSGGRAFKTPEDYEKLIGGLADQLGAGTGSSRAAVDAGIAPNENQVGQTGKIVAPDLYLGIGISGAVQHLAGMKNSKVIAVINTDEEAPLLGYADFALIADAYEAIPEMIQELKST